MRFNLSGDEWALPKLPLPKSRNSAQVADRKIMNTIFYFLRNGMA